MAIYPSSSSVLLLSRLVSWWLWLLFSLFFLFFMSPIHLLFSSSVSSAQAEFLFVLFFNSSIVSSAQTVHLPIRLVLTWGQINKPLFLFVFRRQQIKTSRIPHTFHFILPSLLSPLSSCFCPWRHFHPYSRILLPPLVLGVIFIHIQEFFLLLSLASFSSMFKSSSSSSSCPWRHFHPYSRVLLLPLVLGVIFIHIQEFFLVFLLSLASFSSIFKSLSPVPLVLGVIFVHIPETSSCSFCPWRHFHPYARVIPLPPPTPLVASRKGSRSLSYTGPIRQSVLLNLFCVSTSFIFQNASSQL